MFLVLIIEMKKFSRYSWQSTTLYSRHLTNRLRCPECVFHLWMVVFGYNSDMQSTNAEVRSVFERVLCEFFVHAWQLLWENSWRGAHTHIKEDKVESSRSIPRSLSACGCNRNVENNRFQAVSSSWTRTREFALASHREPETCCAGNTPQ